MANLAQTETFPAGILQLETTDKPLGGPSGIANTQAKQLGDRTHFLNEARQRGRFVRGILGGQNSAVILTAAQAGTLIRWTGSSSNQPFSGTPGAQLPDVATFPEGYGFTFEASGAFCGYVLCAGSDFIHESEGLASTFGTETFLRISTGQVITVVKLGGVWRATRTGPAVGDLKAMAFAPSGNLESLGWLTCNGAAIERGRYWHLFTRIGTIHGAGNGTTTFNIPNLAGVNIGGVAVSWMIKY